MSLHRAMLVFDRLDEDVAVTSIDFLSDEPWPTGGDESYATISARFDAWWGTVKSLYPPQTSLREVRYYREDDETPPFGEVALVHLNGQPGIATVEIPEGGGPLPGQVAFTITKEIPKRRSWGRMFMPGLDRSQLDADTGQWLESAVTTMVNTLRGQLDLIAEHSGWEPSLRFFGTLTGGGSGFQFARITHLRGDSIPDVMRSRRAESRQFFLRSAIADFT